MPKRGFVEQRPWLVASLIAGIGFWFVKDTGLPGLYLIVWKGAGVGLLAIYALLRHPTADARIIALVMALGALGDMVLELNFQAGAFCFMLGHLTAIALYLRHRRELTTPSQKALAVALLTGTPMIAWLLPADRTMALPVGVYALVLGGMAGAAWTSSFPRYRVGIGAVMFVLSDLLIFARMGPLARSVLPGLLIWPLYYFGQFLICVGVIGTLGERPT
ncbi:MAG TPA: lysoplasmalogenase [Novosphingobium sp.]|nr:lysoplasmalogenase [Novosphingobium sp.]